MDAAHRASAEAMRAALASGPTPAQFRAALLAVAPAARDAWLDRVLGLDAIPDDGPGLPPGGVPYLPCAVDALLAIAEHAPVQPADVVVDIGAGVGRAAALLHLLTGAAAIGVEIQPALAAAARALAARLDGRRLTVIEGDAARLVGAMTTGSVFLLYCPFGGPRLEQLLDDLAPIAQARPIRVCCVDLPLPARPWLTLAATPAAGVEIHASRPT